MTSLRKVADGRLRNPHPRRASARLSGRPFCAGHFSLRQTASPETSPPAWSVACFTAVPRRTPAHRRLRKGENELQGLVEQGHCTKPCVPACCFRALRINREGHAANLRRHRQCPFAGGEKQFATESLALCGSIDGKPTQAKDRYVIATEPSRQVGRDAGELDGPRTDRVVPEDTGRFGWRGGNERLGSPGLVVLTSVPAEILVEGEIATIESLAVVVPGDGFLLQIEQLGYVRAARCRAAARSAAVGLGGFSSISNTRAVSRSDNRMRSNRSTMSRAAGNTLRRMKLVTSRLSWAAAAAKRRFSSLVARNSIRYERKRRSSAWKSPSKRCTENIRTYRGESKS